MIKNTLQKSLNSAWIIIFIMDFIKNSQKNISKSFSITIGTILGITYRAGILINESKTLKKEDIFFIATFLMICHAIIEDTLLFVIFGADFWMVITIRVIFAILFAYIFTSIYKNSKFNLP